MIKYKIILCLMVMFIFAIPIIVNPLFVNNYPFIPKWYHYVFVLIICPVLTWLSINFGLKKMKEKK